MSWLKNARWADGKPWVRSCVRPQLVTPGGRWTPDVPGEGGCSQSSANPCTAWNFPVLAPKDEFFAARWEFKLQGLFCSQRVNPVLKIRRQRALELRPWLKVEIVGDSSISSLEGRFNLPYHPTKLICVQTKGKKDFAPVLLLHPFEGKGLFYSMARNILTKAKSWISIPLTNEYTSKCEKRAAKAYLSSSQWPWTHREKMTKRKSPNETQLEGT